MSDASFLNPAEPSQPPKTTQSSGGIREPDRSTKEYVCDILECKGLDYGLVNYSDFSDYDDERFHYLRKLYLSVRQEIINHLGLENL